MSKKTDVSVKALKLLPLEIRQKLDMALWDEIVDLIHDAGMERGRSQVDNKYEYVLDKSCPHIAMFKIPKLAAQEPFHPNDYHYGDNFKLIPNANMVNYETIQVPCVKKDGHLDHHEGWFVDFKTGEDKKWAWENSAIPSHANADFVLYDNPKEI